METLRRGLAARITGMRITSAEIGDRKIFRGPAGALQQQVVDHQISRVARRGKVLILFLREPGSSAGDSGSLLIHPKMTGQLVKAALLDQTAIAGIGNIYADEVLHRARIHPSRPAGRLSQAEAHRLYTAIRTILRAAIDSGGTSFAGYVNEARGHVGYLSQARVFRRQGLPCDVCGTPIIRTTVAGRATYYCPHCQQR